MNSPVSEPRPVIYRRFGGPLAVALLGLLCFANSLFNDFTYDDHAIVRKNPRIQSLANFREIWLTDWWYQPTEDEPLPEPGRDRLYRPLTLFSFALNCAVHDLRPLGYHLVNVLLHAGVSLLVWWFARRLLRDQATAVVAAVLFAVHPVHSEAVAGIVGRGEILAAGFVLLGLLALLPRSGPPDGKRALLAAPLFLAALLSKETAVCFPAVALVTLHAANRGRRLGGRWWLRQVAVLLLPLVVYLPLRYYALEEQLVRSELRTLLFNPLQDTDLLGRLHGPLTILGHYAELLTVPSRLSCDYGLAVVDPQAGPELMTLVGVLAATALAAALWGYRRQSSTWGWLAVSSAMFLASYVLISNTVLLIGVSLAERLMYWPSVPVVLGVAIAVVGFWRRYCQPDGALGQRARLLRLFGLLLLLALGLRSVVRASDWKNNERLFTADVRTYPRGAHLNSSLAGILIDRAIEATRAGDQVACTRQLARAEQLLNRALRIYSRYPEALKHFGSVHLLRGEKEQALRYYESSLRLDPTNQVVQRLAAQLRGETPANQAKADELFAAISQRPDDPELRIELGRVLVALGRNHEALQQCEEALRLAPENVAALRGYGETLLLNSRREQALGIFQRVVARDPADWQTHANLATLLAGRDPEEALHHAQIAFDLQPNNLQTQLGLAEALALNDRVEEALRRLRRIEGTLPADDPFRRVVGDRIGELEAERP